VHGGNLIYSICLNNFFSTLPHNLLGCFKGRFIFCHLAAIVLTIVCVLSGSDWFYFRAMRGLVALHWWQPALWGGMFLPVLVPATFIISGSIGSHKRMSWLGWAIGQAALLGWMISSVYKCFTGRAHPEHKVGEDISQVFKFGFDRGGVFWGWPSSHTTVAFAMAVTVVMLFPKRPLLKWLALAYAFYIGICVSMTIHWFSDFAAGAMIGSVVGVVVGRSFRPQSPSN
jgi:membrane-associated phospholipid phosphatase